MSGSTEDLRDSMRSATPDIKVEGPEADAPNSIPDEPSPDSEESIETDAGLNPMDLQSSEQAELLGAIDKLRKEHIDADISIPQIVVCGDQSSGKSSVLEAIADVPFPITNGTTTRFATEVILRQSSVQRIKVSISPHAGRNEKEQKHLKAFKPKMDVTGPKDFGRLIQEAAEYLQEFEPKSKFWADRLCAEISGPTQPHLTLVDLPGIIHAELGKNVAAGDKDKIVSLIAQYLSNPRTIVLAVVSAIADLEAQLITDMVQGVGNTLERTLGVITKPDRSESGSDEEKMALELAKNERLSLGFGWHVLRNLPHEITDRRPEHRNKVEREFFANGPWSQLSRSDVGIDQLRKKLRNHLFRCISLDLPDLMDDMQQKHDQCNSKLLKLGPGRESVDEKKVYLVGVLGQLKSLIEDGLEGNYEREGSRKFFGESKEKKIRDRINKMSKAFAVEMRGRGRQFELIPDTQDCSTTSDMLTFSHPYTVRSRVRQNGRSQPLNANLHMYCSALAEHMGNTQGKRLLSLWNDRAIQAVFRQMSVPWESIARQFVDECYDAAQLFLRLAVEDVAGPHTGPALMQEYMYPAFDQKHKILMDKLTELLWPFKTCHPMTYNPRFAQASKTTTASAEYQEGSAAKLNVSKRSWGMIAKDAGYDEAETDAADVLDKTDAYYEIAIDTFIENVAVLAVEACLLDDLPRLIVVEDAQRMNASEVSRVADEPAEAREDRAKTRAQMEALKDVIRTCRKHANHGTVAYKISNQVAYTSPSSEPSQQATPVQSSRRYEGKGKEAEPRIDSALPTPSISRTSTSTDQIPAYPLDSRDEQAFSALAPVQQKDTSSTASFPTFGTFSRPSTFFGGSSSQPQQPPASPFGGFGQSQQSGGLFGQVVPTTSNRISSTSPSRAPSGRSQIPQ